LVEARKDLNLYRCEECDLEFEERIWAERCEDHDRKYQACSIDIARHAVMSRKNT